MGKKSSKRSLNKKAQHQIWVANESPEPTYDLSECELKEIPEGVFSTCKVLLKEALILHSNELSSLTDNGNRLENLSTVLVIDLHANSLSELPSSLGALTNLQVLNLSHNALSSIPQEIKALKNLQTLNLSDNKLSKLPVEMSELSSLRSLNISSNKVHKLPVAFCHLSTLETLTLDVTAMKYPDRRVCEGGIEAIMRHLCAEGGRKYVPPSKAILPLLQGTTTNPAMHPAIAHLHPDNVQPALLNYEEMKRRKQEQNLLLEQDALEDSRGLDSLLKSQQERKTTHIARLSQESKQCEETITSLQMKQEADRQRLFDLILEEDNKATELINEIFQRNAESKEKVDLLQELEDERERELAHIAVKNEELALLRKEEMMMRMMEALQEMQGFDKQLAVYLQAQEQTRKSAALRYKEEDERIESTLLKRGCEQQSAVHDMLQEENWQRTALESLMKQKDDRHSQLTSDISSLEKQLARLSIVEMNNKLTNNKAKQEMLKEQREHLTQLLLQLMEQRDLRSKEIARRMVEMEMSREDELADFWLAQMQRLLDKKPQALIDRESQLELYVLDILNMSGADDYVAVFARHKVSIETMKVMSDEDLRRIGVHELGLRKAILKNIKVYLEKIGEMPDEEGKKSAEATNDVPRPATAPTASELGKQSSRSTSTPSEVLTHVTTECVVCLERETSIVFLPCGHVCTCLPCSQPLFDCPMCRAAISQKIILET